MESLMKSPGVPVAPPLLKRHSGHSPRRPVIDPGQIVSLSNVEQKTAVRRCRSERIDADSSVLLCAWQCDLHIGRRCLRHRTICRTGAAVASRVEELQPKMRSSQRPVATPLNILRSLLENNGRKARRGSVDVADGSEGGQGNGRVARNTKKFTETTNKKKKRDEGIM